MKLRVFLSIILLSFTQWALAEMPPKPESCPSASALSSQPFFMAQQPEGMSGYVVMSLGKYRTNDAWAFLMGFIDADNILDALLIGNQQLPNISGTPDPVPYEEQEIWLCPYTVEGTDYQAVAITPLKAPDIAAKFKSLAAPVHISK